MDPFEINAAYRQRQLLDEAQAEGLARTARAARPVGSPDAADGLLGRLVRSARQIRGSRQAATPRKASI